MRISPRRALFLVLASGALVPSCKSVNRTAQEAELRDFDEGADSTILPLTQEHKFCADATSFNIVNAYWLGFSSVYAYATKATIASAIEQIKRQLKADVEFFSNDTDSTAEHHSQAVWIEFPSFAVLAFRGTQKKIQDFVTDAQFTPVPVTPNGALGNVHRGFRDGIDVVWSGIKQRVLSLGDRPKPLFITGHSLGGALATLAAARILLDNEFADARKSLSGLYTFGAPRVGDEAFAKAVRVAQRLEPNFHSARFRNHADIVTRVPPSRLLFNYEHIAPLFYFDAEGKLYSSTTDLSLRRLFMPEDVAGGMIENVADYAGRFFSEKYGDHSMKKYLAKLDAEYSRSADWTRENNRDICDMGMYALASKTEPGPPKAKAYTNDLPIASARREGGFEVRDCCWCYRTWYFSDWGRDTPFKQENFVGVIQEGDAASGNCAYPGGKRQGHQWWQGQGRAANGRTYEQYYKYSECEPVTVAGARCLVGSEIVRDGKGTGRAIRSESWTPE